MQHFLLNVKIEILDFVDVEKSLSILPSVLCHNLRHNHDRQTQNHSNEHQSIGQFPTLDNPLITLFAHYDFQLDLKLCQLRHLHAANARFANHGVAEQQ
jgi:hypothetical protein